MKRLLRVGLIALTVVQVALGVWALAAPRGFYDGFPLPGHAWVAMFPPYNEHLLRDFGGLNLAMAVLFAVGAITLDRRLVVTSLAAYLCFAVPHLVFHLGHMNQFATFDAVGQTVTLALMVVVPAVLIVLTRPRPADRPDRPDRARAHDDAR